MANHSDPGKPVTIGEWLLAIAVALAGFAYLLYRVIQTWGQWPDDAWSAGLRIAELGLVGVFVLWALASLLWRKPTAKSERDIAEPDAGTDREGQSL